MVFEFLLIYKLIYRGFILPPKHYSVSRLRHYPSPTGREERKDEGVAYWTRSRLEFTRT